MQNRRAPGPSTQRSDNNEELRRILSGDSKALVEFAKKTGQDLASGGERERLSSSQIRNVLVGIQRMRKYNRYELDMLKPKLAYAAGRHGDKVKVLQRIVDTAIDLTNEDNFKHFKNLIEAIVGYHRYYGGK